MDTPSNEENVFIMVDLQLMGHSDEVYQQKVILTWSKKIERKLR